MVTKEEVKHLAWLARMELTDKELEVYTKQIEEIISYLNTLDKISLQDVKPLKTSIAYTKFRDDEIVESKEDTMSVVKNAKDRFVKAPKMV
jgi:aspartyl-tRNA(Asn)/glutamyl-tRNA(Gln) amidotransferase subunit C